MTFKQNNFIILSLLNTLERSGYFGLQSFFVIYFIQAKSLEDTQVYTLFGLFYGLIFLMTPFAAYIINKARDPVLLYKICYYLVPMGFALFCLSWPIAQLIGMSLIVFGSSYFRIIVPILLGDYCDVKNNIDRNTLFRKLYTHANLGAFISPILTGLISIHFGWTGAILFVGCIYAAGTFIISAYGQAIVLERPIPAKPMTSSMSVITIILGFLVTFFFLSAPGLYNYLYSLVTIGLIVFLTVMNKRTAPEFKKGLFIINFMILFLFLFMSFYEQHSSSINLFIMDYIQRDYFGYVLPVNIYQSISPLMVVLFGPFIAKLLSHKKRSRLNGNIFLKIAIGFIFLGFAYVCFSGMANIAIDEGHGPTLLLFLGFTLLAIGEVICMPVIGAVITKNAPHQLKGIYLALQNLTMSSGFFFAIVISKLTIRDLDQNGQTIDSYFQIYGSIAIACLMLGGANYLMSRKKDLF